MPTYLGGTFSPLLDISERNLFFQVGGGGARAPSAPPPPAYAPGEERYGGRMRMGEYKRI